MTTTTRFQQGDEVTHNGRPARVAFLHTTLYGDTRYSIIYTDDEGGGAGFPTGLLGRVLQDRSTR